MSLRPLFALVFASALLCVAPAGAQSTALGVKVVPTPDLSKLPSARADELRRARADFEKVKDVHIGEVLAESYGLLGSAYARAGFTDAAAVAFDDAIAVAPSDARWIYARGVLALATRHDDAATGYFERAFAVNKNYLPIRTAVADRKIASGDLEGARRILADYTARHRDQAVPYAMLGDIALRQKRYADAIEQINQALKLAPDATRLYTPLAEAYAASGNAKAAAEARAKAGTTTPSLADPVGMRLLPPATAAAAPAATAAAPAATPQEQDINEAMTALASRKYDAARSSLDRALKRAPKDATVLAMYARVESAAGNLVAAQARAAAAVSVDAKNPLAHFSQGMVLEMRGDVAGAQAAYGEAIRLDPRSTSPRFALGSLLLRTGRNEAAAAQFRAITTLDPASASAWMRLVAAQVMDGHCPAALKDVNAALAKDAHNAYLMQLFVRLASTCGNASAAEQRTALDYAGKLYTNGGESASVGEAYALALAASGKWDDAVKTQQGAMFLVLRSAGAAALGPYREFLDQFQAHKLPQRPWPASAEVFHPQAPVPDAAPAAAAMSKK